MEEYTGEELEDRDILGNLRCSECGCIIFNVRYPYNIILVCTACGHKEEIDVS